MIHPLELNPDAALPQTNIHIPNWSHSDLIVIIQLLEEDIADLKAEIKGANEVLELHNNEINGIMTALDKLVNNDGGLP
ncbi:hypothetical protein LCGC14_1103540 [marine sediment metagenome]|uniref:Uncharacterized protein n=1 Tax=marine sediment metagenome TaxID=412755 RepID=A0A0F9MWQ4_9ZZZZ